MNRGGFSLIVLLLVALIVALLAMGNLKGLKLGGQSSDSAGEGAVQKTRELVDQLNAAKQSTLDQVKELNP